MTNNKKSQILAAVMCASSIIGSYTAVSAANVVNDNNANVISATTELDETISFGGAVDDITINTIKNRGGSFEVDAKGNLVATSVVSNGDVRSDKYSLNTIGANTAGITSTGGSTTIQGVSFANGRMQATQAKIGGVEIKDGHVDGVK